MHGVRPSRPDQARHLRDIMRTAAPPTTFAVASGKGGVGKTCVAVNLALALEARGRKVTLIDVDLGMADADLLLGVQVRYGLAHVLSGLRDLDQVGVSVSGDFRFIPGTSGIERLANLTDFELRRLVDQVRTADNDNDFVILDCGAGISRNVVSLALTADAVVLVTTPEPAALTDTYATAKVLVRERFPGSIHLLVNRAGDRAEARRVYRRIAEVSAKFLDFPIADCGYVLHDRHVELAARERAPFVQRYPRCAAASCLAAVADCLDVERDRGSTRGGFLRRVAGLFA